jgi:hypothetical protein
MRGSNKSEYKLNYCQYDRQCHNEHALDAKPPLSYQINRIPTHPTKEGGLGLRNISLSLSLSGSEKGSLLPNENSLLLSEKGLISLRVIQISRCCTEPTTLPHLFRWCTSGHGACRTSGMGRLLKRLAVGYTGPWHQSSVAEMPASVSVGHSWVAADHDLVPCCTPGTSGSSRWSVRPAEQS